MLSVTFHIESQEHDTVEFELRLTSGGHSEPPLVTVHLPDQEGDTQLVVDGPPLWSECAYKTINRAVHTAANELDKLLANTQIESLEISVKALSKSDTGQPELSKIVSTTDGRGANVFVNGLVGGATFSVETERKDLYSLVTRIFLFCGLPWDFENKLTSLSVAPSYQGNTVEDFVFIDELPEGVGRWFVAFDKAFKRKTIYRDGLVAPLAAWQAFQSGEL